MAGGTMTVTVPNYAMLQQVAQRVTCWAGGVAGADTRQVRVVTHTPVQAIQIPEEIFAAHGALALEPGGVDILAGYVPGTHVTFNAVNGTAAALDPNTCTPVANPPEITDITMNVGGDPLQINMAWENVVAAGTVDITWGDGTSDLAQLEAGNLNHTYPGGGRLYTIRVADTSVPTSFTETTIFVP